MPLDSPDSRRLRLAAPLIVLSAIPLMHVGPGTIMWAAPAILLAALLIAWAAESAQFFIAQGFALAILAWLQTLPEFAVEAVLAWKQQVPLLLANLTGALRLLTGFAWPVIYLIAAIAHRRKTGQALRRIALGEHHSVEVISLLAPLLYMCFVWYKASIGLIDSAALILMYAAYLAILSKLPPEEAEGIDDLEKVPAYIVQAPRLIRIALITLLFVAGGFLIYVSAEPFLGSLLALASMLGVPNFVFVQWVAPFVSEFPEMGSTFYWARTVVKAPMALMNVVSSNINQWTLLTAMLPVIYSISRGAPSSIPLDDRQRLELLLTLGQALIGLVFLINMELAWWEAGAIFALFLAQFVLSPMREAGYVHSVVTLAYFLWIGVEIVRLFTGGRRPLAFQRFAEVWRTHVRP